MTGADDPDDRRTYPWADLGGRPTRPCSSHYTSARAAAQDLPVLTRRRLPRAAGRRRGRRCRLRPEDRTRRPRSSWSTATVGAAVDRPGGRLPARRPLVHDPVLRWAAAARRRPRRPAGRSGDRARQRRARAGDRLRRPHAPGCAGNLALAGEGDSSLDVSVGRRPGAASYDVWVSPVTGGGYVKANSSPVSGTSFTSTGSRTAGRRTSSSRPATPRATRRRTPTRCAACRTSSIGWANLQWPPTMTHTISAIDRTDTAYGQVWIDGVTSQPGATPGLRAQLGFGPTGSQAGRQRRLDLGRRGVQRRRRQQRRVPGVDAAGDDRHLRLRLPLHDDRRPRLAVRGLQRPGRGRGAAAATRAG